LLNKGKLTLGGQAVPSLQHNNSARMSERLAWMSRIAQCSPDKSKTAVQILGALSGAGRTTAKTIKTYE
jgi:hypothetical protein